MHSKFKLCSVFNGIIHVIFLLNILIYFNNGYVKMQLTEKAEKNGEWIWILHLLLLVSQSQQKDEGNSEHDRTLKWKRTSWVKFIWRGDKLLWQFWGKKDEEQYGKWNNLMIHKYYHKLIRKYQLQLQQSAENVQWKYLKIIIA